MNSKVPAPLSGLASAMAAAKQRFKDAKQKVQSVKAVLQATKHLLKAAKKDLKEARKVAKSFKAKSVKTKRVVKAKPAAKPVTKKKTTRAVRKVATAVQAPETNTVK